ncbi:alpha/beta hydrolase [Sphingomonas sp. VNH70]|uniref:alpha/beta hydrolase n=1 Tax=Sphingomonas silueang TaxID=3156617 RepID=UPI0032B4575E
MVWVPDRARALRGPEAIAMVAAVLGAVVAYPASGQMFRDQIYRPPTHRLDMTNLPAEADTIRVRAADGTELTGIEVRGRSDRPLILLFHGNGSGADEAVRWFAPLAQRGYGIIAAEYRGYSGNPGTPGEAGIAQDADAFYAFAKARSQRRPVLVVGHSLGGGVAFGLAMRQRLDALITIGTFTRLRAMAPRIARAFIADRYDNLAAVAALDEPYFLLHGTVDDVVPPAMANELHNAAVHSRKQGASFALSGADHHPDGALVADIIDLLTAQSRGLSPPPLPPSVKTYPFGG